ncbi:hypothetical protein BKA67DRAFT_594660 [Truncatella angustata]|uniref:GMC oxidoreductase n=1 Tax=Truncatella angustata TaxID=152316 RepID=A0A9P8RQR0_9PEZI|nr:uncharacterized protein BKA67DRAFT_594660 [Truncatella angustata]KAH6647727.1 hypothetical protein BKA67DRAFT_594660 [Truncatella angustata]
MVVENLSRTNGRTLVYFVLSTTASPLQYDGNHIGAHGDATYEYVVVGGGTAGLTIASRLAEFASVAIIEAGGYHEVSYGNASVVPLYSLTKIDVIDPTSTFPRRPEIDWELLTVPQTNASRQIVHYAQGKTLGGSSALNTMSYLRSTKGAYQRWIDEVGDDSYIFEILLPFFKRSVRLAPPNLALRDASNATPEYDLTAYGPGSPLNISWNNWVDPTLTWLAKSVQSIGLPVNSKGFSSGELDGGAWLPSTIDPAHATRESSQTSFLDHAIANAGIKVYPWTIATKVICDGKKATGVNVTTNGTQYTLSATKEIIVSAGVFNSPKLLMLSGIGPQETLKSFNTSIVADLPEVGQNPPGSARSSTPVPEDAAGSYSSAPGYISYERLPTDLRETLALGSISATRTRTFFWGSVTLTSSNYTDNPVIDLGWFSNAADAEVLIAGIRRLRQAWGSEAALSIRLGTEVRPGVSVQTDDEILNYIKNNTNTIWHASSTCSMGSAGNPKAVGLRVVDLSIIPYSSPGHPQATVYALVEKLASDIESNH